MATAQTEYWLAGAIEGIIPVLQPVAHAILQSQRDIHESVRDFPGDLLWEKPAGVASVAFHLQHIPGILDRLFTYAKGQQLSASQLDYLQNEGKETPSINLEDLLVHFDYQVNTSLEQLRSIPDHSVFETKYVGRKQIPSNILGLVFHAAEHMQRHTGQLLVTAKVLKNESH